MNNINNVAMASLVHSALLLMGVDGICSPHGAGGIGTLSCPLGFHLLPLRVPVSWVLVDHPLLVPHKVQLVLLEAFLSKVLHAAMWHLAQSPGVAPGVVSADIPLDLLV